MRRIESATLDAIAAHGFDVYGPATGKITYVYFTDGDRIGYAQYGRDGGALSLSTVHIPNRITGTGFALNDVGSLPSRAELESAFIHAPQWAGQRDRESVRKWKDFAAFYQYCGRLNPLHLIRQGVRHGR